MEEMKLYISLIVFFLGLITSIISIVIKYTKNIKVKNNLQNMLMIIDEIIPLIIEAEEFLSYSGEEKKEYVVSRIFRKLNNCNIKIEEEKIDTIIEKLVDFTKEVNYEESDFYTNDAKTLVKKNG